MSHDEEHSITQLPAGDWRWELGIGDDYAEGVEPTQHDAQRELAKARDWILGAYGRQQWPTPSRR